MRAAQTTDQGTDALRPDLCVIGAGAGGLSVASAAAALGVPTVLVEKSRMGGRRRAAGLQSKALSALARRAQAIREARRYGIDAGQEEPTIDYGRIRKHLKDAVAGRALMDTAERYTAMGVKVIQAEACFTDPETVAAGGHTIKARRFVIAVGSRPAVPAIPGLDRVPYFTEETILDLDERPDHLIVLGGTPAGIELAQAFRRLGARVTLLEPEGRILGREDAEMAAIVERALRVEGVEVVTGSPIGEVSAGPEDRIAIVAGGREPLEGSHLLVAMGRSVEAEGLGLDAAGIEAGPAGIVVSPNLRTRNPRAYAIGSCIAGAGAGGCSIDAGHQAGLVIRNALFRLPVRLFDSPVPRFVHTDPELAAVGLTEEEAKAQYGEIRILRSSFADNDRARLEGTRQGYMKAIVTPRGRILGCAIAGAGAGELIVPWVLAMTKGVKVQDLASLAYPHPTLSEAIKGTAVEFLKPSTQNPWIRRLIGALSRLG